MIQTLDNYGYEESTYMKPKQQYEVTISSEDHIITVEDDGDLLARLGLELSGSTLCLKGYDDVIIATTEIPLSTGIEDIKYVDHKIIFTIIKIDGTKEDYTIDISDLVDLYQGGNGIEIEEKDGNKYINVKINDESKDVLSADESGLAIDLSQYMTSGDVQSLNDLIEAEKERATAKEDSLAQNIVDTNANVAACVNQLNENIATIVNEINQSIFSEIERAKGVEKVLDEELSKRLTIEDAEATYAHKGEISGFSDDIAALSAATTELSDALQEEIARAEEAERLLAEKDAEQDEAINGLLSADTSIWEAINNETTARADVEAQLWNGINGEATARQDVDTQLWGAINNESTARADVEAQLWTAINNEASTRETKDTEHDEAINALQTTDASIWEALNNETTARTDVETQLWNGINSEATARQDVDAQLWDAINSGSSGRTDLQAKIDAVSGATDAVSAKTDDLSDKIDAVSAKTDDLSAKIDAVSAATDTKVESSDYDAKVAEIEANEARIESLIPSLDDYATQEWVEEKDYLPSSAMSAYSTTEEMKDICVTETEYATYTKDLKDDIAKTYALKSEIPSLDDYYTKEEISGITNTFATKTELSDGLATKIGTTEAETVAKDVVNNALLNYTPTTGISALVDGAVATAKADAITESEAYTDSAVATVKTEVEAYTDTEIGKVSTAITQNANELHVLSVCNDGDEYDTTKAMSAEGTGVVDESYRLIHKLLSGMDENDLTALNAKLKELIGK